MGYIVEKYPFVGTTGQCLILDPRERLMYPFNFGSYSTIRFGMYYSYTRVTGDNLQVFQDTAAAGSTTLGNYFIGFCNYNTGVDNLPVNLSGLDFIGFGRSQTNNIGVGVNILSSTDAWINGGYDGNGAYFGMNVISSSGNFNEFGSSASMLNYFPTTATGTTNYCSLLGLTVTFTGANEFTMKGFSNNNTYTSNPTTANLRSEMSALGTYQSALKTGFFTTGCTNNSNLMMKPNCLIIYSPALNSRMRIHNLVVERY